MSTARDQAGDLQRTRSCATELVCRKCELRSPLAEGGAYCPRCGKSLDVDYDYELAAQRIRETPMEERPLNIWFLEELLPIHDAVGPDARRRVRGLHAADQRRPAGRSGGPAQPVPQGRQHLPPEPLLQGPRGEHGGGAPAGARPRGDRVRLHRQRRHRRGVAGGEGGGGGVRLLPQPPGVHQGPRLPRARREGVPGGGQLRRSQQSLPRPRGSDGPGVRQHHAAPVLRRGRQDRGV